MARGAAATLPRQGLDWLGQSSWPVGEVLAALATAFSSTEGQDAQPQILKGLDADKPPPPSAPPPTAATALTSRSDMGVLSPSGRCCSSASTIQLAMMVARIMYSNGVRGLRTGREAPRGRGGRRPRRAARSAADGPAASGGAGRDRVRSPRPSRPHPWGPRRGGASAVAAASPRHVRVAVSTADSAARLRPARTPGGEGAVSPPRELEEGPRAGAQSYLKAHVATCTYTGT